MSWYGNTFPVTVPLEVESSGDQWIAFTLQRASTTGLGVFFDISLKGESLYCLDYIFISNQNTTLGKLWGIGILMVGKFKSGGYLAIFVFRKWKSISDKPVCISGIYPHCP